MHLYYCYFKTYKEIKKMKIKMNKSLYKKFVKIKNNE